MLAPVAEATYAPCSTFLIRWS